MMPSVRSLLARLQAARRRPAAPASRLCLSLRGDRVRMACVRWDPQLRSSARRRAVAEARLQQAYGAMSDWEIRTVDMLPPAASLAVAVPRDSLSGPAAGIRVDMLDAVNALLARERRFEGCVVEADSTNLLILVFRGGRLERARARRVAMTGTAVSAALLPALLCEWAATGSVEPLLALAITGDAAPAVVAAAEALEPRPRIELLEQRERHGAFDVDFAGGPRTGIAAWSLLALGAAALSTVALLLYPQWQSHEQARTRVDRLSAALAEVRPPSRTGSTAERAAQARLHAEATQLAGELNRPWLTLIERLEAAGRNAVRLQSVTVQSGFATLQLQVEARTLDDLLRYVQDLAAGAPVREVQLDRHEWKTSDGQRVLGARLVARLDGRAVAASGAGASASTASAAATRPAATDDRLPGRRLQ